MTDEHVTAQTITAPHALLATPPMTTPPLRIPRRRSTAFLHLLQTLNVPFSTHRQQDIQRICPPSLWHETLADRVARTAPYLYIHSLSG
jgi:hypothetical protein